MEGAWKSIFPMIFGLEPGDSRVPSLVSKGSWAEETVFDAMPGDIFVLRNAGNTCTHAEGSILGSLEFCTAALNTKMRLKVKAFSVILSLKSSIYPGKLDPSHIDFHGFSLLWFDTHF